MSDTLGKFAIDLEARVAQLETDLGRAARIVQQQARAMQKTMNDAANGIADGFMRAADLIGVAFTADKLIEMGKASIDLGDQLQKMSQKVGIGTESLSTLRVEAQLNGVQFGDLGGAMAKLARTATEAATGNKQQAATFKAMGIQVETTAGQMRPMQDILSDTAKRFASYQDGAAKSALAQQLFGRSGAELIPLLNALGAQGFGELAKQAAAYNQVMGPEQAKQSQELNDNFTKLGFATSGFANAVLKQLLPGMVQLTDQMAQAAKTTDGYASSAGGVATTAKGIVFALLAAGNVISGVATTIFALYDAIASTFTAAMRLIVAWGAGVRDTIASAFKLDSAGIAQARANFAAAAAAIGSSFSTAMQGVKAGLSGGLQDAINDTKRDFNDLFGTFSNVTSGAATTAGALKKFHPPLVDDASAAQKLAKDLYTLQQFMDKLAGNIGGPYEKAWAKYGAALDEADKLAKKFAADGMASATVQKFIADATKLATDALSDQIDATGAIDRVLAQANSELDKHREVLGMTVEQQKVYDTYTQLMTAADKDLLSVMGPLTEAQQARLDGLHAIAAQIVATDEATKNSQQVAQDWARVWQQAGDGIIDTFSKVLVEGGSLLNGLKSIAQQTVEAIIAYFARLAVINPILNSIFGAVGGSLLPTLANAAVGGAASSAIAGGAANFTSTAAGATQFSIMQPATWIVAGKNLWAGFQSGANAFTMGPPTAAGSTTSFVPGYQSGFGQALGIAGGIYAGYNRYQSAGGGVAGAAGGAAYGVGTYFAGAAVSTGLATGSLAAGFAAIPVVGWVALAAMAVDYLSGGKLFGTKGKLDSSQTSIDVGAAGVDLAQSYTLKGQKALFGGSKYTTVSVTPSAEAEAAAQSFFDALKKDQDQFAKQFNAKVGDLVGGTFTETFDKNGNSTGTTDTVLGKTYTGETQDQFGQRLIDENRIAILGTFDSALSGMLDQFRGNVDSLTQVTQGLAETEAAFQGGAHLLALGSDQTLSAMLKLAEGMQQTGETIDQTFDRILQAQAQYDQFVAQFKPPKLYVDDFEAAFAGINDQMASNIAQANALAKAAGAAGASQSDLTNIYKYAASQMAAATAQLQESAQETAFSLGLTTTGSLDQINAEISQLQSEAGNAASAVGGFSAAMTDAAQRAADAMNLLLGDLSPLNDQQKLQQALQGLRAGTVTQDQVLQIGRRLYASSQAYNDLFAQVQGIGVISQSTGGAGTSGSSTSPGDQQRLSDLLAERDELQKAATASQYQTLAQQIAEIAMAKGEDYQQVLDELGIKASDLEKGLGIKSDADLTKYLNAVQAQTDSDGHNTASIVDVLNQILDALTGTDATGHSTRSTDASSGNNRPVYIPPGRTQTDADAQAIGAAVADAVERRGNVNNRRNYAPALQP